MKELDILYKIEKMVPPPYLYTRIAARLQEGTELVSKNWLIFSYACIGLLLSANVTLFSGAITNSPNTTDTAAVTNDLNLYPSNQFYYD